ncbi:MAG: STAS/SEC14 domain-containing protein [Proteobacteria bacterium]|nr:STAS/SEC14 domain-containing protein [Pseudomonadota bacterium]
MIKILQGFPDNVIAFSAEGRVTRRDYDEVLIPKVKEALQRHDRIRCYYELGAGFSEIDAGAAWEDFVLGLEHLTRWERVAVVTDVDWIRIAVNLFRFLIPGMIQVFPAGQAAEARRWIGSA